MSREDSSLHFLRTIALIYGYTLVFQTQLLGKLVFFNFATSYFVSTSELPSFLLKEQNFIFKQFLILKIKHSLAVGP